MKHHFHILFAGALLLTSLIILHHQKGEGTGQPEEIPGMQHLELAAEIPALGIKETRIPPGSSYPVMLSPALSAKLLNPASQNSAALQVRIKKQRDIYLEMRPVLDLRSGKHLYHPSVYGDPPGFSS